MDCKLSSFVGCMCRISSYQKWKPVDLYEFLERLGSLSVAMIPAPSANIEARANAGMFPPPNKASHGPAPSEIII